jgi:hypothetical protein
MLALAPPFAPFLVCSLRTMVTPRTVFSADRLSQHAMPSIVFKMHGFGLPRHGGMVTPPVKQQLCSMLLSLLSPRHSTAYAWLNSN